MFYFEKKRYSYCVPATRENFYQTIDNPFLANDIKKIRAISAKMEAATDEKVKAKLHDQKGKLKAELPAWVFSAGFIGKSEKTLKGDKRPCRAEWRKSEYAKLNGLVMMDIDHVGAPRERFTEIVNEWNEGAKGRGDENTPAADGNLAPTPPRSPAPTTSWCGAFCKHFGILFVHVTSSGYGLRIIFKGNAERGNIADNQAWMARQLGVKLDEVCKDSVRNSFCCTREDIIYLELENLLNYNDEEFEKKFGEDYREGRTQRTRPQYLNTACRTTPAPQCSCRTTPAPPSKGGEPGGEPGGELGGELWGGTSTTSESNESSLPSGGPGVGLPSSGGPGVGYPSSYRGVSYVDICTSWMRTFRRSLPAVGERNNAYFALVSQCLRYICDFNEDFVVGVAPDYGLSEQERRACARSAISQRRLSSMPKKLRTFLEGLGCRFDGDADAAAGTVDAAQWDFSRWSKTFGRWFDNPVWKPVCAYLPESARINGLLAAGSMWGTLLSGCHLRNWYDGSDLYLTFMTYIIGEAASGKGDYREIDRLIMEPLRQADERGRKAEEAYQEKMKQLSVSKAKKDDVPEEKHFAVRYLPTDTTLKQKLERCRYALAQFGAEQRQVACYNFETELSSKINYEKNSWNSSQDFDKKSFDCEMTGSESRSSMTTNGLVNAFFNFVVTGTPDALQKKINARNCLDGLPTRLLMGIQPPSGYRMIERSRRRRPDKDSDFLRTVGNKLMQCGWDVNLEQKCNVPKAWQDRLGKKTSFADALYWWGQQKALTCELEEDKIGNYFRKRAPMIAVKLGVVDAIMNSLDSFVDEGQINLNFSSIELSIHLCDYIFESQIWYFGNLIEESLDSSAISGLKYENTKKVRGYNELPQTFKIEDVEKVFNISRKSASNYCSFWRQNGYIDKVGTRGNFKKVINVLI